MNLTLIKPEKPKNWALVLTGNRRSPPTIAQYKANPNDYFARPHGIYEIEAKLDEIKGWGEDVRVMGLDGHDKEFFHIKANAVDMLNAVASGVVTYNGNTVKCLGRFIKNGSEINFYFLKDKNETVHETC